MLPLTLRRLGSEPDPDRSVPAVLPWIVEAGNPFLDWLLGPGVSERTVDRWMRRPSSELSIRRVTALERDGEILGGFLAMDGGTLRRCRLDDVVAIIREAGPPGAAAQRARIQAAAGLFPTLAPEEFYLSKLGIAPAERGKGLGRWLMERFLEQGREHGASRYRLEVARSNERAFHLYRSMGFEVVGDVTLQGTDIGYIWLCLDPGGSR